MTEAKTLGAPYELLRWVAKSGKLPVPNFSAGGIATPADAALMMQLGAEAVFVGSGIFKSTDPATRAPRRSCRRPRTSRTPTCWRGSARIWATRWSGSRRRKMAEKELLQTRGW